MSEVKFAAFTSQIELPFYSALFSSKLDHAKLDDSARFVLGVYEANPAATPDEGTRMQILGNALTNNTIGLNQCRGEGMIKNVNTIEDFKQTDKTAMVQMAGRQIWDAIKDGTIYSVPSLLSAFTILSYADLKKYKFTYWFAFPALHSDPLWKRVAPIGKMSEQESTALVEQVGTWRYGVDSRQYGFFLVKKVRGTEDNRSKHSFDSSADDLGFRWEVGSLRDFENGFFKDVADEDRFVAFVDPSTYPEYPSWPLRNLLVLVRQRYHLTKINILCYRDTQAKRHEARSIILPLAMDSVPEMETTQMPKVTGWERNGNQKLQARQANLGEYMDPTKLADQAVDLNLKLMKWRISPGLDLDIIRNTSCLLLGAGTLGSYVSRNLMGWGVRKISFVDYGSVSFSNPVRQPLFEFKDCLDGGVSKATKAADALKAINPGVESEGHVISVPMLGHPMTDEEKTKGDFAKLKELIDSHDVIFLLMDSRESRWLPTVMGKAAGKIVMNAALGFDTYVVMRQGAIPKDGSEKTLGCYFCNDVVVATDSQKDLTLDQQCTVTRPGVAAIASALLVELLASVLQHPEKHHAPAPVPSSDSSSYERDPPDHALGLVPHQIRGFLSTFQNLLIRGESYPSCSACSKPILEAYQKDGWDFVKKALEEKDYVAELSGLAEVQRRAEAMAEDVEFSEDEGAEGDGDGEAVLL
ncbi:Ubiquitin-like modifier-activating enzyme atg7 [Cytospora mali]|uniref:Ubiquitin-like modifier-activating enzyme ATG7 n=1 Tax=Cytospora mali TaxID=578113 RepID=A0A194VAH3_CYTMA|nr:Ubiquitin-like modifier-activating enzyme atg7 [Valsa mali var. pyri (nom. inval.)]